MSKSTHIERNKSTREQKKNKINHIFGQCVFTLGLMNAVELRHLRVWTARCFNFFSATTTTCNVCMRDTLECYTLCLSYNISSGKWVARRKNRFSSPSFYLYCFSFKIIFTFRFKTVRDACVWDFMFIFPPSLCVILSFSLSLWRTQFYCWPMTANYTSYAASSYLARHSCAMNSCKFLWSRSRRQMDKMLRRILKLTCSEKAVQIRKGNAATH